MVHHVFSKPIRFAFFCFFFLLSCHTITRADDSQDQQVIFDLNLYNGQFKLDSRFYYMFGRMPALAAKSLSEIETQLGIRPKANSNIVVRLTDVNLTKWGHLHALTYTTKLKDEDKQFIVFFSEYFLSNENDVAIVLQHEMVHAVMRDAIGKEAHKKIPKWLREGLAVYVAKEGELKIKREFANGVTPEKLITSLKDKDLQIRDYPYAYLAIVYLKKVGKKNCLKQLLSLLSQGVEYTEAISTVTGLSYEKFKSGTATFARKQILAYSSKLKEYQKAIDAYKKGDLDKAMALLSSYMNAHPTSPLAPNAQYYFARCKYELQDYARAEKEFLNLLHTSRGKISLIDEAVMYSGLCAYGQRHYKKALAYLTDYTIFYSYSTQMDRGLFFLAMSHSRIGNSETAKEIYQKIIDSQNFKSDTYKIKAKAELQKLK